MIRCNEANQIEPASQDLPDRRHLAATMWNPWNWPASIWALVIGLVILVTPFVIRTWILSRVPSIREPFDVDAFVASLAVPEEDNAWNDYRQAKLLYRSTRRLPDDVAVIDTVLAGGWELAENWMRDILWRHEPTSAAWLRGTVKDQIQLDSEAEGWYQDLPNQGDQKELIDLARARQLQCLHDGNLEDAWTWSRAMYRFSGHVSHINYWSHSKSVEAVADWAQHPEVTSSRLKEAMSQLNSDSALYQSNSTIIKLIYVSGCRIFMSRDWIGQVGDGSDSRFLNSVYKVGFWSIGEPELTLRVLRHTMANQIPHLDVPLASRRKEFGVVPRMLLFDSEPGDPQVPGLLDPAELAREIRGSRFAGRWLNDCDVLGMDLVTHCRDALLATLQCTLAAQAYQRDHGMLPDNLDELVPDYLTAVPVDPCDPAGGPLRYRRIDGQKGIVWSVGGDRIDQDGDITAPRRALSPDVGIEIKIGTQKESRSEESSDTTRTDNR